MDESKVDPRISRTRRLLTEALVELCSERGYAEVAVADIARRAGVNRATFYLHYEGKDDLLERGLDSLFDELGASFVSRPAGMSDEAWAKARMAAFFRLLEERRPFFAAMLSGVGASSIMARAEAFLERFMLEKRAEYMTAAGAGPPPDLTARMVVSVLLGMAGYGLAKPGASTPESMAEFYIRFMKGGLGALGVAGRQDEPSKAEPIAPPAKRPPGRPSGAPRRRG